MVDYLSHVLQFTKFIEILDTDTIKYIDIAVVEELKRSIYY